ncbi:hypothetical protein [Planktothrix pseudagardhii]|uniref:Uncharacterized protein n=1 Tax=Planktothrix pseudagardhii TaxID=132604 RepID=A0A9W4GAN0_9CYAN|nr:hypothetical protein [Planktothrix pseudagardhii]CAD5988585.1 hypothetical protein NO713_05742 [Planktothrix pseudagardhii]
MREELATAQRDLEASRVIRGELALELANATSDRKLAEERLETERFRAEELIKQIEEKDRAIATLKTENQKLKASLIEAAKNEIFLSEELQRFKYGVSLASDEPHGEQLQLFPTPEEQAAVTPKTETENTESPPVKSQHFGKLSAKPLTVNSEPSSGTTKPKLLTPGELAKWINKTHHPEKPISDQNVRDWFNPKKNSDKNRTAVQEKYGFRLNHKDKRGTLHFTLL